MTSICRAAALFGIVFAGTAVRAQEPERLDAEKAKKFGGIIAGAIAKIEDLPVKLKLDGEQAMGMTAKDKGAMLIPAAGLTIEAIKKVDKEVVPVGALVLHKVGPAVNGEAISADQFRTVEISIADDKTATITVVPLAAARVAGRLVLLVYGKDKAPLIVGTLSEAQHANSSPLELEVRKGDRDGTALLLIGALGQFRSSVTVVAQE